MAVLLFWHEGEEVLTAAWSASASPGKRVKLCYQWGADHISFFQSATGIRRVTLPVTMATLLGLVARGGIVDLRVYQEGDR